MTAKDLAVKPAFPQPLNEGSWSEPGMSLRAYFAGQAMAAMIGTYRFVIHDRDRGDTENPADYMRFDRDMAIDRNGVTGQCDGCNEIAEDAVAFADALLAELAKAGGA